MGIGDTIGGANLLFILSLKLDTVVVAKGIVFVVIGDITWVIFGGSILFLLLVHIAQLHPGLGSSKLLLIIGTVVAMTGIDLILEIGVAVVVIVDTTGIAFGISILLFILSLKLDTVVVTTGIVVVVIDDKAGINLGGSNSFPTIDIFWL